MNQFRTALLDRLAAADPGLVPGAVALGSIGFSLFFSPMFLQPPLKQVPQLLLALAVGVLANAVVRFVLLRRNAEAEFMRVRHAFRARLAAVVRATEAYLAV